MRTKTPLWKRLAAVNFAALSTDQRAAKAYGVSERTLALWRKELGEDPKVLPGAALANDRAAQEDKLLCEFQSFYEERLACVHEKAFLIRKTP